MRSTTATAKMKKMRLKESSSAYRGRAQIR
jgi:hypothetical protein